MEVSSQNVTTTAVFLARVLTALNARPAAGLLGANVAVHLYTGSHVPTPNDTPTTYSPDEANFTGYTAAAVATPIPGPVAHPAGGLSLFLDANWVAGVVTPPGNTITGYWITDEAGDLVGAEIFASPIPIVVQYDSIELTVYLPFPYVLSV